MGGVHAGPESRVLEGVSWDEARQMQDAQPSSLGTLPTTNTNKIGIKTGGKLFYAVLGIRIRGRKFYIKRLYLYLYQVTYSIFFLLSQ